MNDTVVAEAMTAETLDRVFRQQLTYYAEKLTLNVAVQYL